MRFRIPFDEAALREFCRQYRIVELSFFGSVLTDDFRDDSDVDMLVSFAPDAKLSLFDLVRIEDELGTILGRKVDLVERADVERSENYIRRRHVLSSAELVYRQPRASWTEAFRAMAENGDDKLLDAETPTKWDEEEWEWDGPLKADG